MPEKNHIPPPQTLLTYLKNYLSPVTLDAITKFQIEQRGDHAGFIEFIHKQLVALDNAGKYIKWNGWIAVLVCFPWRLGKIILDFDHDLLEELKQSTVTEIPFSAMNTLPLQSFYFEMPPGHQFIVLKDVHYPIKGVMVLYIPNEALNFLVCCEDSSQDDYVWQLLTIGGLSDTISIEESLACSRSVVAKEMFQDLQNNKELIAYLLNLCLYLATKGADYVAPKISIEPVKTKKGIRWFEPASAKKITVGKLIGQSIRAFKQQQLSLSMGGKKTPHIRRAHFMLRTLKATGKEELIWRSQSFINAHLLTDAEPLRKKEVEHL